MHWLTPLSPHLKSMKAKVCETFPSMSFLVLISTLDTSPNLNSIRTQTGLSVLRLETEIKIKISPEKKTAEQQ